MTVISFVIEWLTKIFNFMRNFYPFGDDFFSFFDILLGLSFSGFLLSLFFAADDD